MRWSAAEASVGIEDLRRAVLRQRLLQGIDAKIHAQRVGQPPGEHLARVPVDVASISAAYLTILAYCG